MTGRNRESEEVAYFRQSILRTFKCPFQEENACRYEANPAKCNFSHVTCDHQHQSHSPSTLQDVPSYVCIYHLINSCRTRAVNSGSKSKGGRKVPTCPNGLHPSLEEMLDLPLYRRQQEQAIDRFTGPDGDRECGVCLETVRSKHLSRNRLFAILENCPHCFCFACIKAWQEEKKGEGEIKCPLCQQATGRIIFRRRFITQADIKQTLFRDAP